MNKQSTRFERSWPEIFEPQTEEEIDRLLAEWAEKKREHWREQSTQNAGPISHP